MKRERRKLAAIMFTDIAGYSALSQKNEALALELLEKHRALLRPLFSRHKGREVKTIGDAFLVEFSSAVEAVECAIEIQKALQARNALLPAERRIQVRIGIHLGDIVYREGDILGDGVNIASRLQPLAEPGEICLSEQVAVQVRNKIKSPLVSCGVHHLKNIETPQTTYRIILPWTEKAPARSQASVSMPTPKKKKWPVSVAAGMTEALITELSMIQDLRVISRTSTMRYKKTEKSLPEIARDLKVDAIVEGSTLLSGAKVRITAQLVKADPEQHLWAKDYKRDARDIELNAKLLVGRGNLEDMDKVDSCAPVCPPADGPTLRHLQGESPLFGVLPGSESDFRSGRRGWLSRLRDFKTEGLEKGLEPASLCLESLLPRSHDIKNSAFFKDGT
ncbi:MAG: adenylate/guanylate cyclase domain-containing protein [Candidatus Aminicenantales bacterium]